MNWESRFLHSWLFLDYGRTPERTQREPTQTQKKHANSTEKGDRNHNLGCGPSSCEVTELTTAPLHCLLGGSQGELHRVCQAAQGFNRIFGVCFHEIHNICSGLLKPVQLCQLLFAEDADSDIFNTKEGATEKKIVFQADDPEASGWRHVAVTFLKSSTRCLLLSDASFFFSSSFFLFTSTGVLQWHHLLDVAVCHDRTTEAKKKLLINTNSF